MGFIDEAIIALGFGFFFILVVIPMIMVLLGSVLDILWRQDIGVSKLFWLGAVMFIPIAGLLYYWLVRPKGIDLYTEDDTYVRRQTLVLVPDQARLPDQERLDRAA